MPNRHSSTPDYRYGFNGMEKDDEVSGTGNMIDYGYRMQNVRLGRFISIDPLTYFYPEQSPYQFAENTPIVAIDYNGLQAWFGPNNAEDVLSLEGWTDFVNRKVPQAVKSEEIKEMQLDCANFQLWLLIEYFRENGVHIQIVSWDSETIFDSSDPKWKDDYEGFLEKVRRNTNAEGLETMMKIVPSPNDVVRGDLLNYGYHLAMFWNLIEDDNISVAQGSGFYHGKNDPETKVDPLRYDYERPWGLPIEPGEDGYSLVYRWNFLSDVPDERQVFQRIIPKPAVIIKPEVKIKLPQKVKTKQNGGKTSGKGRGGKKGKKNKPKASF